MIVSQELSNAAVEVLALLDNVSDEVYNKIPEDFINYLREIESFEYYFEYDTKKSLEEQNFSKEALKMIGLLYKDYICNDTERIEYEKLIQKYKFKEEEEKRKKYNPKDLFNNCQTTELLENLENVKQNSNALIVIKEKDNFIIKILKKLKSI